MTTDRDRIAAALRDQLRATIGRPPNPLMVDGLTNATMLVVKEIAERRSLERAAQELRAAAAGVIDRADRIDILARATALDGKP
jgi:hypothetical protein